MFVYLLTDDRVSLDFGRALQQARTAKGMTQKDLATVSEKLVVKPVCVFFDFHGILYQYYSISCL